MQIVAPTSRISDSGSLGGLGICFSNKVSVNTEAAGWGSTLWEPAGLQGCPGCLQGCRLHSAVDFWRVIGDVSLLSKLKPFGACILGGKNKAFVSEKWTHIFLSLLFCMRYLCIHMKFSMLSFKEKEIVDQTRASRWYWSAESRESYSGM